MITLMFFSPAWSSFCSLTRSALSFWSSVSFTTHWSVTYRTQGESYFGGLVRCELIYGVLSFCRRRLDRSSFLGKDFLLVIRDVDLRLLQADFLGPRLKFLLFRLDLKVEYLRLVYETSVLIANYHVNSATDL